MRFFLFLLLLSGFCCSLYSQEFTLMISSEVIEHEREKERCKANDKKTHTTLERQVAKLICDDWNYQVTISLSDRTLIHIPAHNSRKEKQQQYIYEELALNPFAILVPLEHAAYEYYKTLHEYSRAAFKQRYMMQDLNNVWHTWHTLYLSINGYLELPQVRLPEKGSDNYVELIFANTELTTELIAAVKLSKELKAETSLPDEIENLINVAMYVKIFCNAYNELEAQTEFLRLATHDARQNFRRLLLIHEKILDTQAISEDLAEFIRYLPEYLKEDLKTQIELCQSSIKRMKEAEKLK